MEWREAGGFSICLSSLVSKFYTIVMGGNFGFKEIKEAIAHALCGANLSRVDGSDLHLLTHGVELMFARQLWRSEASLNHCDRNDARKPAHMDYNLIRREKVGKSPCGDACRGSIQREEGP